MAGYDPTNTNPATLQARERRRRKREARLAAGWHDGRYRDPAAPPYDQYANLKRWRMAHMDEVRLMDRVYKGMKRNRTFMEAWPLILAHYGGCCLACGSTDRVSADHVQPVMEAPIERNTLSNLQPLCRRCNSGKRGRAHDYRPDNGAWIAASFPNASKPLHPV